MREILHEPSPLVSSKTGHVGQRAAKSEVCLHQGCFGPSTHQTIFCLPQLLRHSSLVVDKGGVACFVYRWRVWKALHAGAAGHYGCFHAHIQLIVVGLLGRDKKVQLFCDLTTCGLFFFSFSHFITKTLKCDKRLV